MSNTEMIKVGSKMYSFPRMKYETDKSYFLRRDFFSKLSPSTEKEYLSAINMSITWANMKLLGCVYRPEVVEAINKVY